VCSTSTLHALPHLVYTTARYACNTNMGSEPSWLLAWQQNIVSNETSDEEITKITQDPTTCRRIRLRSWYSRICSRNFRYCVCSSGYFPGAGKIPRRTYTIFRTRRKSEIKKFPIVFILVDTILTLVCNTSHMYRVHKLNLNYRCISFNIIILPLTVSLK
jgi:hypothetical protein